MHSDFTFSIIKPDAIGTGKAGAILNRIEEAGFTLAAIKMLHLTRKQAEKFYEVHRDRGFFPGLVEFMTSAPVIVMILKHDNAVEEFRRFIGATDPTMAEKGTIRADFATSVQKNVVHGSDSPENAIREAGFFFSAIEIY